ncbi:MAG: MATE family efflux transporter, partial [Acidobacteria bacterium]|nr:MATE family efflux transporter [Acidobacteriota bacterium]
MAIAWPLAVSMVSLTLKQLVDTLMVAGLGTEALAAVGLGGVIAFNILSYPIGVFRSQKPLVSQYLGAGDTRTALSFGAQGFYLAIGFSFICLVLAWVAADLTQPLISRTGLSAESVGMCTEYMSWRIGWGVPYLLGMAIAEYQRGTGRTRLPMAVDLIAHPLNVFFNWVLIFGNLGFPELGVKGAAIGTGLADLVGLILLLRFAAPRKIRDIPWAALRFHGRRLWRCLTVGSAGGIQFVLEIGSFTMITIMIGHLGTTSLAAHQAAIAVLHLSWLPGIALGDGCAVLVGKYVGKQNLEAVHRTFRSSLSIIMPFMLTVGLGFVIFSGPLMSLFLKNDDPEVQLRAIELGSRVLIVAVFWQFFDALQILFRFSLRAAGDHKWVMFAGILCSWILSVPLVYLVVFVLEQGLISVWLAWSVELVAGTWIFYRRWRGGVWKTKRLVRDDESARPP